MRCKTVAQICEEVMRIICEEQSIHPESRAEFFFRGECRNYKSEYDGDPIDPSFQSTLDRNGLSKYERDLYEEAMRLNVASFEDDRTMVDRIARMQHYHLPTRFADMSDNALLSTHFACGGGEMNANDRDNGRDGFIRVIKVAHHKLKSYTSDIIIGISHLPLVNADNVKPSEEHGLDYLRYEITNNRPGFSIIDVPPTVKDRFKKELQQVWAFKPMMNSRRIRKQGGLFLAFGCGDGKKSLCPSFSPGDYDNKEAPSYGIKQIGYVQIAADSKRKIREELRHFGVQGELVYPELSNVCAELGTRFRLLRRENEK